MNLSYPVALSIGSAMVALGGYPEPPQFWIRWTSQWWFQLITLFILVWQAGHVPAQQALVIATLFLIIVHSITQWEKGEPILGWIFRAERFSEKQKKEIYYNPRSFKGAIPS